MSQPGQPEDMQVINIPLKAYHGINSLNNGTLNFIKLYLSNSKSVHEKHQEQKIWNQKDDIKNPDSTEKIKGKNNDYLKSL